MKTIKIQLFKFDELTEEAQNKAIQREIENVREDSYLLHFFTGTCEEQAKEAGFFDTSFQYSLSCSQGDGLSFSAGIIDLDMFIKQALPAPLKTSVLDAVTNSIYKVNITGNMGNYCYASRKDVEIETDFPQNGREYPRLEELINTVQTHIQNVYLDLCKKLENSGYEEIEYLTSEECAKESLISNDYDFTVDGKIY